MLESKPMTAGLLGLKFPVGFRMGAIKSASLHIGAE